MSVRSLCLVALALICVSIPAQNIQGPEPGAFLYSYDTDKAEYNRTYFNTLQEAAVALDLRRQGAMAHATTLNQTAQSNVNVEAVGDWLIFFEQWHLWQGWVMQEYGLEDLGDSTFEALPGTPHAWEGDLADDESENANAQTGGRSNRDLANDAALAGYDNPYGPGAIEGGAEEEAPSGSDAAITISTFMALSAADRDAQILQMRQQIEESVQAMVEEDYAILTAILDEIELSQDRRERRDVYTTLQQREITDLCEIILNRQAAEEIQVGETLYLFSEQPLTRTPDNSVNIPTSNLTPYDIFTEDGIVRETP